MTISGFFTNVNADITHTKELKSEEAKQGRSMAATTSSKHYELWSVSKYNSDHLAAIVKEHYGKEAVDAIAICQNMGGCYM